MENKRKTTAIASVLFLTLLAGCQHIRTDIEIAAPPDRVWEMLADIDRYPEWNPYHVKVEGALAVGQELVVTIHKPNGEKLTIKPHVMRLVPGRELTWGGGIRGLFYGEHVFLVEPTHQGHTRLVHKEEFTGIFVPLASLGAIDEGYRLMNRRLKERAEARP